MRQTRQIMGMPICVAITDPSVRQADFDAVFDYFETINARFSPFRDDSEISRLNRGALEEVSAELCEILSLAEETRQQTMGYFNITRPDGGRDPCGIVKGWAIRGAARRLKERGFANFFVDAGGDIQTAGRNEFGREWQVGIRNPFDAGQTVKVVVPRGRGVATSGNYLRGAHIYDPHRAAPPADDIVSLTIIARDVLEADRFATAAFAMGRAGIEFIERTADLEAYEINSAGMARMTSGFCRYVA